MITLQCSLGQLAEALEVGPTQLESVTVNESRTLVRVADAQAENEYQYFSIERESSEMPGPLAFNELAKVLAFGVAQAERRKEQYTKDARAARNERIVRELKSDR